MLNFKKIFQKFNKTLLIISICFISLSVKAETINLYLTDDPVLADLTIGFTDSPIAADINVWIGTASFNDIDVCFTDSPTSNSIDINIVSNPSVADKVLCITDNTLASDKVVCITQNAANADICLGLWDNPTSFTTDIYIEGLNNSSFNNDIKVGIVYALGLLKKK